MAVHAGGLTPARIPAWARPRVAGAITVLACAAILAFFASHVWVRHHAGSAGMLAIRGITLPGVSAPDAFVVFSVRPGSPAAEAGLRRGDAIVGVAGLPAADDRAITERMRSTQVGERLPIVLVRDGTPRTTTLEIQSSYASPLPLALTLLHLVLVLSFIVVGGFVCIHRPEDARARLFFLTSIAFTVTFTGATFILGEMSPASTFQASLPRLLYGLGLVAMAGTIANALFFHFTVTFPRPTPVVAANPARVAWIYLAPAIMTALMTVVSARVLVGRSGLDADVARIAPAIGWLIVGAGAVVAAVVLLRRHGWRVLVGARQGQVVVLLALLYAGLLGGVGAFVPDALDPIWVPLVVVAPLAVVLIVVYAGYTLFASGVLLHAYRVSHADERRQVKWPLWGLFVMSAGSLVLLAFSLAVPWMEQRGVISREPSMLLWAVEALSWLLLALFPFPFAAAILRYRLMDIDVIIRRTLVYGMSSAIVVGLLVLLAGGLGGAMVRTLGVQDTWVTIAFTLAVGLLFVPLRNRIDAAVARRVFHRRAANDEVLRQLRGDAATETDTQALRQRVVDRIAEALQVRSLVLFTRPQRDPVYWASAKVGAPDAAIGRCRMDATRIGRLVRAVEPAAIDLDPAERAQLAELDCVRLVPVHGKAGLLAFFCVGPRIDARPIDEDDERLLAGAATELAAGIQAIRERRTDREAVDAYEIQRGLLPRGLPEVPTFRLAGGWKPAAIVSGDYYTAFALGPDHLALCIADVSGKGMPAALIMSNVQAALKAIAIAGQSPATVCDRLNRSLAEHITPGRFVTFVYGVLDVQSRTLRYVNAGHNPPLLVPGDGGDVVRLATGGIALGFFEEASYQEGEVPLPPGSRLVLYTDGVVEALNPAGEEYGDERLIADIRRSATVPAAEQVEALLATVTAFAAGELGDDATMLVVEALEDR